MRTRTRVLLILTLVLVSLVGVAAAAGGGYLLAKGFLFLTTPTQVARQYVDALIDEDYATAYGLLCGDERARLGQAEFAEDRAAEPRIEDYSVGQTSVSTSGPVDIAEVKLSVRRAGSGTPVASTIRLIKDGNWWVCPVWIVDHRGYGS